MPRREAVLQEALELSPPDRAYLADALLASIGKVDELSEAQKTTLRRRQAEMKANPAMGIPWDKIKASLKIRTP